MRDFAPRAINGFYADGDAISRWLGRCLPVYLPKRSVSDFLLTEILLDKKENPTQDAELMTNPLLSNASPLTPKLLFFS